MENDIYRRLRAFQQEHNAVTKGPLSLLIQLTRAASDKTFPLNPDDFLTKNKGQVSGLGGANLKKILRDHDVAQVLAAEGGRTSRGNIGLMIKYLEFLNRWRSEEAVTFNLVEAFWAEQVREFFRNQPFTLTADTSQTIGESLEELFEQARKRQRQNPGTQYLGTILQHLVGAKLSIILPPETFQIHGASVADASTERSGDFVVNDIVIHCTTAPGAPLMEKCKANIRAGFLPVVITILDRVKTTYDFIDDVNLRGRIDVWDIQQFMATNVNERSMFDNAARNTKLADIIARYNEIISEVETDPSLRIEFEVK